VKKSLLVEADGGPLSITIAGANVPDATLLDETIAAIVLERPEPEPGLEQHLARDKAEDNDTAWAPAATTTPSRTSPRSVLSAQLARSRAGLAGRSWSAPWPGSPGVAASSSAPRSNPSAPLPCSSSPAD